jgi:DNA anti-recombination protein RmuC
MVDESRAQSSVLKHASSLLASGLKYAAYPIVGTVFAAVLTFGTYFFFDRGKLKTQNELLQSGLDAEQHQTQTLQDQHSAQVQTLEERLKTLASELDAEREHARHLQAEHETEIQNLKLLMAIQGKIPAGLKQQFNTIIQHTIAQR